MPEESESIIEKITKLYEKYAPKNITLEEFTDMVQRDPALLRQIENDTLGEFSTFNSELVRPFKNIKSELTFGFRHMLKNPIDIESDQADFISKLRLIMGFGKGVYVVNKYVDAYIDILRRNDDILFSAWTFEVLNEEQRQELAIRIIDEMNKLFDVKTKLKVKYKITKDLKHVLGSFIGSIFTKFVQEPIKNIKADGVYNRPNREILVRNGLNFLDFLGALSHEYGHFIDHLYPDMGMLGAQIAFYGGEVYSNSAAAYSHNPTERSSFVIEETVKEHIKPLLRKLSKEKPELYIKAVEKISVYKKVEFAALKLRCKKFLESANQAKQNYQKTKKQIIQQNYPDYEKLSPEKRAEIDAVIQKLPEVIKAYERYLQTQNQIPKYYYELQDELQRYNKVLNQR